MKKARGVDPWVFKESTVVLYRSAYECFMAMEPIAVKRAGSIHFRLSPSIPDAWRPPLPRYGYLSFPEYIAKTLDVHISTARRWFKSAHLSGDRDWYSLSELKKVPALRDWADDYFSDVPLCIADEACRNTVDPEYYPVLVMSTEEVEEIDRIHNEGDERHKEAEIVYHGYLGRSDTAFVVRENKEPEGDTVHPALHSKKASKRQHGMRLKVIEKGEKQ